MDKTFICQPNASGEFGSPCVGYFTANAPKILLEKEKPTFVGNILRTGILYSVFCEGGSGELHLDRGLKGWDALMVNETFAKVSITNEFNKQKLELDHQNQNEVNNTSQYLEIHAERSGILCLKKLHGEMYAEVGKALQANELLGQIEVMKLYFEVRNPFSVPCKLKKWHFQDGDAVRQGDLLATLERDES